MLALAPTPLDPARGDAQPPPVAGSRSSDLMGPVDPGRWMAARDRDAPVQVAPLPEAPRRGSLSRGARVRLVERRGGPGCRAGWGRLPAPAAWICVDHLRALTPEERIDLRGRARRPTRPAALPPFPGEGAVGTEDPLPFRYALVAFDALPVYATESDVRFGRVHRSLGEGYGVVVVGQRQVAGVPFVETRRGLLIERSGLRFPAPSGFHGTGFPEGASDGVVPSPWPAWVAPGGTALRGSGGRVRRRLGRRDLVWLDGMPSEGRGPWLSLAGKEARVQRRRLNLPRIPPDELLSEPPSPGERWVAVDVAEQVVVALEGRRPVWATLASTGRRAHPTPLGEHRVWAKLTTSDMGNQERDDVSRTYALEAVPWVLYFAGSVGFHATFWHDDFGRPRSHGCVNLSPLDARWLFRFARPALPSGWSAVLPTRTSPGTRVLVWDSTSPDRPGARRP